MFEPQTRAALTEQLTPPTGFELSHAVGTTFTLDLATALAVPLAFASHRISSTGDTLGVLEAVRRASDRIDVFAQAGELSMGTRSDLVAFLEPMVHPVQPRRGLFHPKVWFLEYRAGDQRAYRFLCMSRNLTGDRSWDVVVRLDGERAADEAEHPAAQNEPLVALLRRLPDLCVQPLPDARRENLAAFADRWRSVSWEKPEDVRRLAFHVLGHSGAERPDLSGIRSLIVSPFLSDDGLADLRVGVHRETHLLSRVESLDRLAPASLDQRLVTYVLDDAATQLDDAGGSDTADVAPSDTLSGLHAKAVIVDRRSGSHVFLGSANATRAAWRDNVEVVVELIGSSGKLGVDATLTALGELKDRYPTQGGQTPSDEEEAERTLEGIVRRLAGTRVTARVLPGDPHALRVWADEGFADLARKAAATGVSLRWHLLTRADLGGSTLAAAESEAEVATGIPLTDITPFIVLVARTPAGTERRITERRTILVARLLDDIDTRRDAIIARQLTDRAAFIRLLTLILELSGVRMPAADAVGTRGFFGAGRAGTMRARVCSKRSSAPSVPDTADSPTRGASSTSSAPMATTCFPTASKTCGNASGRRTSS